MSKKNAFLFPGQGTQYPGMGKDFYDAFSVAKETFQQADEFLSDHFSKLIFEGKEENLTLTKNSQMAIYITSVALLRALQSQFPSLKPTVCAGLSLGEYTALYASGRIDFLEGLSLVRARALYMDQACKEEKGTMRVVLGLDEERIVKLLPSRVWVANLNCPGQIVIAGAEKEISLAEEALKAAGARRVLPLEVSGAFHTPLMQSAQRHLQPYLLKAPLKESKIDFVMNVPGDYVTSSEEIRQNLIDQVVSPTRWEKGMRKIIASGIEYYFEIGPGKSLTGMNKKIGTPGVSVSIEKVEDLEAYHAAAQV